MGRRTFRRRAAGAATPFYRGRGEEGNGRAHLAGSKKPFSDGHDGRLARTSTHTHTLTPSYRDTQKNVAEEEAEEAAWSFSLPVGYEREIDPGDSD